jgi:hypothetical protein
MKPNATLNVLYSVSFLFIIFSLLIYLISIFPQNAG